MIPHQNEPPLLSTASPDPDYDMISKLVMQTYSSMPVMSKYKQFNFCFEDQFLFEY